jgi:hypothetical protein
LVVSILADMAEHIRWLDRPSTALHLHDLALNQLPADRRYIVLRSLLTAKRVENGLCHIGPSRLPEAQSALSVSFDLHAQASEEDMVTAGALWHRALDTSEAELSRSAAVAYLVLAQDDPRLAAEAERHTVDQLANVPEGQGRSKIFGLIRLTRLRGTFARLN